MIYGLAADVVLLLHLAFVVFVVLGALLAFRWPWIAFIHVPAALWGVVIELFGIICPLTPFEQALRRAAGESGYSGDFIDRYLGPIIYPPGLDATIQCWLAGTVVAVNVVVYGILLTRRGRASGTN